MKTRKKLAILVFLLGLSMFTIEAVAQPTLYVDARATGANDGSRWEDAFNHLQDALTAASGECEIWVAQGVYKPDLGRGITLGDQRATFQLKNGVTIKGGYAGFGEPDPDDRVIETYITILSGDLGGNDIPVGNPLDLLTEPTRAENSRHVVNGSRTDATAVLYGFIITAGHTDHVWPQLGGGMWNESGSPTISHCTFVGNCAKQGGGMHNYNSSPTLTSCEFRTNASEDNGGGLGNSEWSNPTVNGCTFASNSARNSGGGIFSGSWDRPTLTNCTFRENFAGETGGGVACWQATLTNCTFSKNFAGWKGGGINTGANMVLTKCTFIHNSAGIGGGISTANGNPTLTNCVFVANQAKDEGGGLLISSGGPALANCVFIDNSTDGYGGAVSSAHWNLPDNTATFINCTFHGNLGGEGGGLLVRGFYGRLKLTNCILWANQDNDGVVTSAQIHSDRAEVTYCCIQGWTDALGITSNISQNPMFLRNPDDGGDGWGDDPTTPNINEGTNDDLGNLHLWPSSPCIDAGDNTAVPLDTEDLDGDGNTTERIPVDLDGNPRFIDVPPPGGRGVHDPPHYNEIVDLGAYESTGVINLFASSPIPADGATHESTWTRLQWEPGETAVSHDVYFGDSIDDVEAGTGDTFRGNQVETSLTVGLPGCPYPEGLTPDATYYWRIDEHNAGGTIVVGQVWSFTVKPFEPVEETVEYQIAASEDDGYAFSDTSQNLDTDFLRVGFSSFAHPPYYMSGMVFRNVNIPQGTRILNASLKIRAHISRLTDTVYGMIQAEAVNNATAFGSSQYIASLPRTSASVNWDLDQPWSADAWYESPDIAEVIQEVINRDGWSANNALAILYSTRSEGGYRNFSAYDRGSDYAPILEITYIP